jgi:phosphatidylserine/phosphatidylglycerophosphate/cardiolipin synthase-like enzyme
MAARYLFRFLLACFLVVVGFSPIGREYFAYREEIGKIGFNSKRTVPPGPHVSESAETFLVGPDPAIKERFLSLIGSAETRIDFSVYLLSDPQVLAALVAARERGVRVRAILEHDVFGIPNANRKASAALLAAGAAVVSAKDDPFAYTHAKYLVADGTDYVLSTANYAKTSLSGNREFFVFGHDPTTAEFLSRVFSADFADVPFSGPVPDCDYLAPVDARQKLVRLLESATVSVRILAPSLSDPEIRALLSRKAESGVDVAACLGTEAEGDAPRKSADLSPKVRMTVSQGPYLHAKAVLVDGRTLYVGSANLTQNSLDRNREIGQIRTGKDDIRSYETTLASDCKR